MATVTPPRRARSLSQSQLRVRSPLAALRGYIRAYVSLEGAAVCLLYLALWFWIGLLLDYGFFRAFTIDWVQELPRWFRGGVLVILLAGLVAAVVLKVLLRLFRGFRDSALALVLEKKFPRELGDRLITAVELSDPRQAAGYGYSPALVEENIHQAAERVEKLPIGQVFNWKRLYVYGFLVVLVTAVLYVLAGAGFVAARAVFKEGRPLAGYGELNEISTIWAERNLLLRNTIWPRRSHLEVFEVKAEARSGLGRTQTSRDGTDLRVGKGKTVSLRVRAWKYVLADQQTPEGWRLLTWEDGIQNPALVGGELPAVPADWVPRDKDVGLTADEVELHLKTFDVRTNVPGLDSKWNIATASEESGWRPLMWADLSEKKLGGLPVPGLPGHWDPKALAVLAASRAGLGVPGGGFEAAARQLLGPQMVSLSVDEVEQHLKQAEDREEPIPEGLQVVFARLNKLVELRDAIDRIEARASDPANSRILRRLVIPSQVTLTYRTPATRNDIPLQAAADNEFTGSFGELKETVTYTVRGENYYTARRTIQVVDLPQLEKLESEEERPASLYYRTNDVQGKEVRDTDLRGQRQPFKAVGVSLAGEVSALDVPSGTFVTLVATTSKPVKSVSVQPGGRVVRTLLNMVPGVMLVAPGTGTSILGAGYLSAIRSDVVLPGNPEVIGEKTFQLKVEVRQEQRFTLVFEDSDGEFGTRTVQINAKEDSAPKIREFSVDEVIRRTKDPKATGEVYMVAAGARIPFKGKVRDDYGLGKVRYAYTIIPSDFLTDKTERAQQAAGVVPLMVPAGRSQLLGLGALVKVYTDLTRPAGAGAPVNYEDIPAFRREVESRQLPDGRREFLELATIQGLLKEKQADPFRILMREFSIKPDPWTDKDEDPTEPGRWVRAEDPRVPLEFDFGLWKVRHEGKPIRETDEAKVQRRYQIDLWLEAEDTNVEVGPDGTPGPGKGRSGETFTFVVVPENELLSKIAEEEEVRHRELRDAVKPLPESRDRLAELSLTLSGGVQAEEVNGLIARADALDKVLADSQIATKGVYTAYERILREMRTNQLREDFTRKVYRDVVRPLSEVDAGGPGSYDRTRNAVAALRKALDNPGKPLAERVKEARPLAQDAKQQMDLLIQKLNTVLDKIAGISDINTLITLLHVLERAEDDQSAQIERLRKDVIKKLFED